MRSLSDTLERLARLKSLGREHTDTPSHLEELSSFGSNPGALAGRVYVPSLLPKNPALVVVLHGCTQTASGYDHGAGWSKLAERHGFVVLLPEQVRANNGNLCFNWFLPGDTRRGQGEAHSIRQMIDAAVSRHGIDTSRIHVSGLSAGGGMANVMLATYPEIFAGGAIIAGLPYGVAATVPEAFDRMRGHGLPPPSALQSRLRAASTHQGPWPTISVWQGTQDNTVAEANAQAIVDQWRAVHNVGSRPDLKEKVDGQSKTVWKDDRGRPAIEYYSIAGMGHGTPVDPALGYENAAPYLLDVGISSTLHSAKSWGLLREGVEPLQAKSDGAQRASVPSQKAKEPEGIQQIIENALRMAGLMR
ncbi:PHB depolymerase family esterase [Neorhizobium galegae]|uniref:extracellular catalytic domain type 1 short-chain-length polyhydroxyalkanoate depolymerase n=1 Tax=Neorhizobium galegae TaxID=399 RepID=UPI000621C2C7|nr:PHB depolymerase family esterase [Neorhizobium galegae]MCQ1766671.1 PHB depolymerase family esterase [Neorhizobium galegae]MCQ1845703.1 PHB depolymerase family esterase [Neorhizobium galegae]CDZ42505.1 Esterase, PHB depolymerase family [Neorhizobium galegae bv. officinalis]